LFGYDPVSGNTWNDELCKDYPTLGIAAVGGAAVSHWMMDPRWFDYQSLSSKTFENLLEAIQNEFSWPQRKREFVSCVFFLSVRIFLF